MVINLSFFNKTWPWNDEIPFPESHGCFIVSLHCAIIKSNEY